MDDLILLHRVHVVDYDLVVDLESLNAQITSVVSDNNFVPDALPLTGPVETLVDVAIETKCWVADSSSQS